MNNHRKNYNNQEEPRCTICSSSFYFRDPFNPFGMKCPHILHCGHSACEGCLTAALTKNNVLTCPVCNTVSEAKKLRNPKNIKRSEILTLREDFPLNVYAVGQVSLKRSPSKIVEGQIKFYPKNKKMTDSTAIICNECNSREADCSCRQCETELCSSCFTNIHNSVTLRKHEKLSLKEKQTLELFEENLCKIHKGLFLNIFCKDCEIFICKECIIDKKHLEHHCTDVFEKNEDKLPEFSELFDECNNVLKQLYATRKKVQTSGGGGGKGDQVHDEEAVKVERQVQAHYSYLHGMLQRHEDELLRKIRSVGEAAKESLESVAADLDKNIKEVENLLSLMSSTIISNKIKELPLDCLIEKLRNITGTPCHLVLNDEEDSKFELHIDSDISEILANHCTVDMPSQRVFELRSKDDLPESCKIEDLKNIPDPVLKPDLSLLNCEKEQGVIVQNSLLNAIAKPLPSQMEAKTKPQDLHRNKMPLHQKNKMGSQSSLSSQDSCIERISRVSPLSEGMSELVIISHLLSPNSFYVQRKCSMCDIEKMREHLTKIAHRSKNPPSVIEFGQIYLVQYSKDGRWYRGRVTKVDGNICDVFYVDYGNTETRVPKSKLRDISDKYTTIPDQALHCGLYNCAPVNGHWSLESTKLLTTMAYRRDLTLYVERINQTNGFHEVHLQSADGTTGSFTDALIYSGYATRTESTSKEEGLFKQSTFTVRTNTFKNSLIKEHEVFDGQVTHINSPANFYMQKITDGGQLMMKLMADLSDTYSRYSENEGLIFTPTIGMAVAARFKSDGHWYRATILAISQPRKVQVKYVDYGNVAEVNIEDIRELLPRFLRVGIQGLKCSLNDIAPKHPKGWPASAKAAFEKLVLNKGLLRVYVEKVKDDNSLSIVLYETLATKYINISGVLVKRGHAVSTGQTSVQSEYACRPDYEVKHNHTALTVSDSESVYSELSEGSRASKASGKSKAIMNRINAKTNSSGDLSTLHESQENRDQTINGRVKIEVLKIMSPSEIYVTTASTAKLLKKLIKDMTAFYQSQDLKEEEREWSAGDLCAVLRLKDNQWYRGVITEISHTSYKVFIKDVVEVLDVDRSLLRTLDSKFYDAPDGSTKIHLGGICVPGGLKAWPASTNDYLRRLMEESDMLYVEKLPPTGTDSIRVRLWRRVEKQAGPLDPVRDEWYDIGESLVLLGFALIDRKTEELNLSPTIDDQNDKYVMSWLNTSFQNGNVQQKNEKTVARVSAEAPYFSDLEKEETASVVTARSVASPGSVRAKSRGNRGRFPSQRACYIPSGLGPEAVEQVKEWKPALPFKKLQFVGQPTYVDYDCNIYIQDIDNCEETLELLEKAFLSLYENSEMRPHEEDFVEGQICIAFFQPYRKWYRGKVLKVKKEHVEVLFVDYGNVEHLQPRELRKQVTMSHIPIQCHKCRTDGIIPISPDGKWPIQALDFIHGTIVDKRCEVKLKAPSGTSEEYVILNLKLPGGEDLLENLLSMHYATYVLDCEKVGAEEEEEDEEIIEDPEIQLAISNNETSKALAQEIQNVSNSIRSSLGSFQGFSQSPKPEEGDRLIEDHVKSLQQSEPEPEHGYDWYDEVENSLKGASGFISELDKTPRMELRYRDLLLPDSMVEFTVDVQTVCSHNSLKVTITECDDPEVMAYIEELNTLQTLIQEEADSLPRVTDPVKDHVCLGLYSEDQTWYRAVIKNVTGNKAIVYYVDYGNEERVPLDRLREIKAEWTLLPVQAFQVTLHNVREGPNYEVDCCRAAYLSCLSDPPYTMAIETRFPSLQVELYNNKGELAYQPLLDDKIIIKEPSNF